MKKFISLILIFFNFFIFFTSVLGAEDRVLVKVSYEPSILRSGDTLNMRIDFLIPEGAHIYSHKEGEGYLPTKINIILPDGFKLEDEHWGEEKSFESMGIKYFGYEKNLAVIVRIGCPKVYEGKDAKFKVEASWLMCKDLCMPDGKDLEISIPVEMGSSSEYSLLKFLMGAFLGGIILNFMPCVFPVIGLKVLSFAKDESEFKKILNAIFYSLGIIISFIFLALLILLFKRIGNEMGWGFQLQNPYFVCFLIILFLGIGLNLLGVFEVGTGLIGVGNVKKDGLIGSLLTGVLAVVVASPCSAPFMGSALGYALSSDSVSNVLYIFLFLGLGMAFPYMALSLFPSLTRRIPKAGKWMEYFKKILSVPIFMTCLWLLWVVWQQTGLISIYVILVAMMLFGISFWIYGKFCPFYIEFRKRIWGYIFALIFFASGTFATVYAIGFISEEKIILADDSWSEERVNSLLRDGKKVFVDFTASWCLTCQLNKRAVLATDSMKKFFEENDVVLIYADWTNRSVGITKELEKFGRASVPLNLIYFPDRKDPKVLPTLLTEEIVKSAILSK